MLIQLTRVQGQSSCLVQAEEIAHVVQGFDSDGNRRGTTVTLRGMSGGLTVLEFPEQIDRKIKAYNDPTISLPGAGAPPLDVKTYKEWRALEGARIASDTRRKTEELSVAMGCRQPQPSSEGPRATALHSPYREVICDMRKALARSCKVAGAEQDDGVLVIGKDLLEIFLRDEQLHDQLTKFRRDRLAWYAEPDTRLLGMRIADGTDGQLRVMHTKCAVNYSPYKPAYNDEVPQ